MIIYAGIAVFCQSCFTGVENTAKINISKKEEAILSPKEEDNILSDYKPLPLSEWQEEKEFIVADKRLQLLIESEEYTPETGDKVTYRGIKARNGADGSEKAVLEFSHGEQSFFYPIDRSVSESLETVVSSDIPMLIDSDMIGFVKNKLQGRNLWTKTSLWYDGEGNNLKGKKYYNVSVYDVTPGDAFFPIRVSFYSNEGSASLLMNIGGGGNDSRSFSKLFYLKDPKLTYRNISDDNWRLIQNEQIKPGMTKEECRLSKGNPSEIESGHNYSNTVEIWMYPNGSFLRFIDGILTDYK